MSTLCGMYYIFVFDAQKAINIVWSSGFIALTSLLTLQIAQLLWWVQTEVYLCQLKPALRTCMTSNMSNLFRQTQRHSEALQLWRRSWLGSFSTTNMAATTSLKSIKATQILSGKTTSAIQIKLSSNQNQTNPLVHPLSNHGQKLSQCSPPARRRRIALLLVSIIPWTPPYLLHATFHCLPAALLYHNITSNIHTPTMTASSPAQCRIRLLLISSPGVS